MTQDLTTAAVDWRTVSAPRRIALGLPAHIARAKNDSFQDARDERLEKKGEEHAEY